MFRRKKKPEEISIKPLEKPKLAPKGHSRATPARPTPKVDLKNVSKPSTLQEIEAAIKAKKMVQIPSPRSNAVKSHRYHIKKAGTMWGLYKNSDKDPQETFKTQKEAISFAQTNQAEYILYTADGKPKA